MNLFEIFAKISVDTKDYENGLNEASEKTSAFGEKLKSGLATAAKVGAAALSAASAGVVALTKAAVENYAEYEQLVGGVETLFGLGGQSLKEYAESVGQTSEEALHSWLELTTGQRKVLNNADEAYKTAGLSANDYMQTVTSFSAALIQSLDGDTAKAADIADQAIIDMSDNANKMGTAMESIQVAYQGFAKQNYTINYLMSAA